MKTSSFFLYDGPGSVSIARAAPRGMSGFRVYSKLAPGPWFKSVDKAEYERRYFKQLNALDPRVVVEDLNACAGGYEPVLLCWETMHKPGEWCHRHMVAEWLKTELGMIVPEYKPRKIGVLRK